MSSEVVAAKKWANNAALILDVARLGYLRNSWLTLDPTYGRGSFWTEWQPDNLVTHDIKLDGVDFRHLPHDDGEFDVVVFDPPYKLNGTPDPSTDERYGVDIPATWQDRIDLIRVGMTECARVLRKRGYLLLKCQNQVSSGKIRWQTFEFWEWGKNIGLDLEDKFEFLGGRPQPDGRRQLHARQNMSTLLVFRKIWHYQV